ncbi:MAG TPA: hypothetical protein VM326_03395 [Sphingomicrobium sp.]|jgi:uncharacterized lipoprotein|nr:hypothetical protein [Sphingomicrobium sp.]
MTRLNWLFAAAGMAALAACGGDRDEMNAANDMNTMETLPVDNSIDMNTGMTNDVANDMNAMNTMNTADNAVTNNSY